MVKKITVALVLALFVSASSYAFDLSVGVDTNLGFSFSEIVPYYTVSRDDFGLSEDDFYSDEDNDDTVFFTGSIAASVEIGLAKYFAIQLEPGFTFGNKANYDRSYYINYRELTGYSDTEIYEDKYTVSWTTFDFGILLKGRFLNQHLYVLFGPTIRVPIGDFDVTTVDQDGYETTESVSKDDLEIIGASTFLTFEIGGHIPLGLGALEIGLRTNINPAGAINDNENTALPEIDQYGSISLHLSYKFNIIKAKTAEAY